MRRGKPLSFFKTAFELSYLRRGLGSEEVNNNWRKLYVSIPIHLMAAARLTVRDKVNSVTTKVNLMKVI